MAVIDFSVLEQFCELLGEDGKKEAGELVSLYLTDAPVQIGTMEKGLSEQSAETVRNAAHTFKSSCANVGAFELQNICQVMETEAANGDLSNIKNALAQVTEQFNNVKISLEQWAAN